VLQRIGADRQAVADRLQIGVLRRLLGSRLGLRLARATLSRGPAPRPHQRVASDFFLQLAAGAYADRQARVVWANIFVPPELFWGLGLAPFFPETWAGLGLSG
jgi:hypothetical protein